MNYVITLVILIACCSVGVATANGQDGRPIPTFKRLPLPREPVSIVCLQYGEGDNWLRDFAITVKNISGRPIYDLQLAVLIAEGRRSSPVYLPLQLQAAMTGLPAGKEATLTISEADFNTTDKSLAQFKPDARLRADVVVRYAYFGNSGWYKGAEYLQNPNALAFLISESLPVCTDSSLPPAGKSLSIVSELAGEIPSEPVRILGCRFGKENDWLKDLKVELENISDQPISYLECLLLVCNVRNSDNCVSIPIIYEGSTEQERVGGNGLLQPRERVTLGITPLAYERALTLLSKEQTFYGLNECDLMVGRVYYEDMRQGWNNKSLLSNMSWGKYSSRLLAYPVPKRNYIFGYLDSKENIMTDISANRDKSRDSALNSIIEQPPMSRPGRGISRIRIRGGSVPIRRNR